MAAAEKVNNPQFEIAKCLIQQCQMQTSVTGNPIQRVVHNFSDTLQERIDRETEKKKSSKGPTDVIKAVPTNHSVHLVVNNTLPLPQVLHFTAVQAILDSTASVTKIHVVDLSIKHGLQWTILMQALSTRQTCPIDSLKITAVGDIYEALSDTGKRLPSFAESLNLNFEFQTVITPELKDLREYMFELEDREAFGVYSDLVMNSMIVNPQSLQSVMRVIQKLKLCIMVVIDVEAKHNSRCFIARFTETLFYYSALFDCVDSLMDAKDEKRMEIEGRFFAQGIKCTVATEGRERVVRQVGIKGARFGLMEDEVLSEWSMYQAGTLVKQFVKDGSCTLMMKY